MDNSIKKTRVLIDIDWDSTDEDEKTVTAEEVGLPEHISFEIPLPENAVGILLDSMDPDEIVDRLSDEYGYCICGLSITYSGSPEDAKENS